MKESSCVECAWVRLSSFWMRMASRRSFSASSAYIHSLPTLSCRLAIRALLVSDELSVVSCPLSVGPLLLTTDNRQLVSPLVAEVDRLGLLSAPRHLLLLRAVLLVPRHDGVGAGREVRDGERAVRLGDGVEGGGRSEEHTSELQSRY